MHNNILLQSHFSVNIPIKELFCIHTHVCVLTLEYGLKYIRWSQWGLKIALRNLGIDSLKKNKLEKKISLLICSSLSDFLFNFFFFLSCSSSFEFVINRKYTINLVKKKKRKKKSFFIFLQISLLKFHLFFFSRTGHNASIIANLNLKYCSHFMFTNTYDCLHLLWFYVIKLAKSIGLVGARVNI